MRGRSGFGDEFFSFIRLEERVPSDHPLRMIRGLADEVLAGLSGSFSALYAHTGRPSIPPEMLLRATLLQALYSVRSERMLMEQINYNLLFRWFVGLSMDAQVWHPTGFTHNRDRLLSSEHFSVDGTLIDAWASMKSFEPKDKGEEPPAPPPGRNAERNFRGETRSNETHASRTDPDTRLYRKSNGQSARLCYMGHVLMENRNGLVVDSTLTHATGVAEREAALIMLDRRPSTRRITLGADKAYEVADFVGQLRARKVTPHIAVNGTVYKTGTRRKSAIDNRTKHHPGYEISQRCRKRIEEVFGWTKASAGLTKFKLSGLPKTTALFSFFTAAYNLVRLPKLLTQQPA